MTPEKYTIPHLRASFGPSGQLVQVMPNAPKEGQPAVVVIQDGQQFLGCDDTQIEAFNAFPGPLVRLVVYVYPGPLVRLVVCLPRPSS